MTIAQRQSEMPTLKIEPRAPLRYREIWDDCRSSREYVQDLRYTEIQAPLLAYLLPFC